MQLSRPSSRSCCDALSMHLSIILIIVSDSGITHLALLSHLSFRLLFLAFLWRWRVLERASDKVFVDIVGY